MHVVRSELGIAFRDKASLELDRPVPLMRLWFTVDNRSRMDVELDRTILEVWVGQPMLHGSILTRAAIKSREKFEDLAFEAELTSTQVAELRRNLANPAQGRPRLRVHIRAYFLTRLYWIEVVDTTEQDLA